MNGVYFIFNKANDKHYVGSSMFPEKRLYDHKINLKNRCHSNKALQEDFNRLGENNFTFEILIDNLNEDELLVKEQEYIDSLNSKANGYNVHNAKLSAAAVSATAVYKKSSSEGHKNIKISYDIHQQLKIISAKTGIRIGVLIDMGAGELIKLYEEGTFDILTNSSKHQIRRDGTLVRTS